MKTILLVDDNDDLRELYGAMLRRAGYDVREADNGASALTLLDSMTTNPCLLLLDLMMPIMNGSELLQILHERGRLVTLPVIVLSAGGRPADVPEAQKFLRKPFDPDRLLDLVRDICG